MRAVALLVLSMIALVGCTSTQHAFMGVPDDQEKKIDDPQSSLRGVPIVTTVQPVEYQRYVDAKRKGEILKEERLGDFVYFAVRNCLHVPAATSGPGMAGGAYVDVTERYKAEVPR